MFKTLFSFILRRPQKLPKSKISTFSGEMTSWKGQALVHKPSSVEISEIASTALQTVTTATSQETRAEFSDPPVDAGVLYVLASRGHEIYTVDLSRLTCTCSQFSFAKQAMARNQVQKYCTHLFQHARQMGFCRSITPNHDLIKGYFYYLENSGFAIGDTFYLSKIDHNDVFVVQKATSNWIDVITRKKNIKDSIICTGEVTRYGYDALSNRWSYGDAPFHPIQIKAFIRSLPSLLETPYKNEEIDFEFPLQNFLQLDPLKATSHKVLIDKTFEHLREMSEVSLIELTLEKLQKFEGVNRKRLASEWYEHGRNLQSQGHERALYFLRKAQRVDPKIKQKIESAVASSIALKSKTSGGRDVLRSVKVTKEIEWRKTRLKLGKIARNLLDIDIEESRFSCLPNTKLKQTARKLLDTKNPEWYKKKDTFRGYLYADFVRDNWSFTKSAKFNNEDAKIIDYIASLAILDGTISDGVMATLFRAKGEIALSRKEKEFALKLFHQALAYNPNVGVKKVTLELEMGDKSDTS